MNKSICYIDNLHKWQAKNPFFLDQNECLGYEALGEFLQSKKTTLIATNYEWLNFKTGSVQKGWKYTDGNWQKIYKGIKPNLFMDYIDREYDYPLYEEKKKLTSKVKFMNYPDFSVICGSKLNQYLMFKDVMPKTVYVSSPLEYKEAIEKINTDKIVIKPNHGRGGYGIKILDRTKIQAKDISYPTLFQEFVESSGISGIGKKEAPSDLRLVFVSHNFCYALTRIAKENSLLTNVSQGGTCLQLKKKDIPIEVWLIVRTIQNKLRTFSLSHYSLDFYITKSRRAYLIEMNTMPGLDITFANEKNRLRYYQEIYSLVI